MSNVNLQKGDKVRLYPKHRFGGREGVIVRFGTAAFPDFVYVDLFKIGRERVQKRVFIPVGLLETVNT